MVKGREDMGRKGIKAQERDEQRKIVEEVNAHKRL